jgi:hypothetical protein
MEPIEFRNDDNAYLLWLAQHRGGFVLNRRKYQSVAPMTLHRATCTQIAMYRDSPYAYTGASYVKLCADATEPLREYVERAGAPFRQCQVCKP